MLLQQNTNEDELFQLLENYGYQLFWPHDSTEWVLSQYDNTELTAKDIQVFEYEANEVIKIAKFNRHFMKAKAGKQFDLLAFPQSTVANFKEITTN
jgi:hypothetical protein